MAKHSRKYLPGKKLPKLADLLTLCSAKLAELLFIKYSKNEHNAELEHSIGGVGAEHVRTTGDGYF